MADPTPTPAPYPVMLRPVNDDPVDELRFEMTQQFGHVHARLDRVEERQGANLDLAVEAIKAANASSSKKTAVWVTIIVAVISALGVIAAAAIKGHGG